MLKTGFCSPTWISSSAPCQVAARSKAARHRSSVRQISAAAPPPNENPIAPTLFTSTRPASIGSLLFSYCHRPGGTHRVSPAKPALLPVERILLTSLEPRCLQRHVTV